MKKAVIFDMDGVISDTVSFHAGVESTLLERFGIILSPEDITKQYLGYSDKEFFTKVFLENNKKVPNLKKLISEKYDIVKDISRGKLRAMPQLMSLLNRVTKDGYTLSIASSATRGSILHVVDTLKIRAYFTVLVSAEDVRQSKPAPDIFLLAAKQMGILPKDVVVIEDGRSGMLGAKAAGMKCIGLVTDVHGAYPADILVSSLGHITLDMLRRV